MDDDNPTLYLNLNPDVSTVSIFSQVTDITEFKQGMDIL